MLFLVLKILGRTIMARLSISLSYLLTEEILNRLNNNKIYTISDYLDEDSEKLSRISKLSYKEVLNIRQELIVNFSIMPKKGLDYYNNILSNSALMPTFIKGLDQLLDGGILTQNIIEICGLSSSGKTQICLTIVTNIAQNNANQQIYYITTKGDFSGKRIYHMLEARNCTPEEITSIMERIRVFSIMNFNQLCSLLYHFKERFLSDFYTIRLIIIDSLPTIIYPLLSDNLSYGLGLLNNLSNVLKYIMVEHNVAFLIVNCVTRWVEEDKINTILDNIENADEEEKIPNSKIELMKPTLGKYWLSVPNIRLLVERQNNSIIQISLEKNAYLPLKATCQLSIENTGVS